MEKKTYTKFDLERLQKEYSNANSKRSEEVILQMMEEVKAEIGEGADNEEGIQDLHRS